MEDNNISNSNIFNNAIKGIFTGILCAYIIIYALRPSVPNPDIILEIIENKFIFIPLFIINYYLYIWDKKIGILALICILSLIFDYLIFINNNMKTIMIKNIDYNNNENIIEYFSDGNLKKKLQEKFNNICHFLEID